jgi:hypothetical protein
MLTFCISIFIKLQLDDARTRLGWGEGANPGLVTSDGTDHGTMPSSTSCHPPLASASPDQCTGVEQLRRPHIHVAIPTCRPALQDAKIWLGCGRGGLPLGDQGDDVPSLHAALSFLRYVFWLNMAFLKLVFTLLYNLTQFAQPNCGKEVVPLQPPIQNKTGMFPLSLRYHQLADTIYLYVTKTEPNMSIIPAPNLAGHIQIWLNVDMQQGNRMHAYTANIKVTRRLKVQLFQTEKCLTANTMNGRYLC